MTNGYYDTQSYGRLIENYIKENGLNMSECTIIVSQYLKKIFEENRPYFNYTSLFEIPIKTTMNRKYVELRVKSSKMKATYVPIDNGIIL